MLATLTALAALAHSQSLSFPTLIVTRKNNDRFRYNKHRSDYANSQPFLQIKIKKWTDILTESCVSPNIPSTSINTTGINPDYKL